MKTITKTPLEPGVAATVAPEDLKCGDYVAVLNIVCEVPSFMWCCESLPQDEPVRIKLQSGTGTPLKIKAICLPFVFVKYPNGATQTLDIRRTQFVRLGAEYAKLVWDELKSAKV